MEAARAYFLEPTCSPQPVHSQPPAGTPETSPAGLQPSRGALQAALQAQQAQQQQLAGQRTPPTGNGSHGTADELGSSGPRGNLMLRLSMDAVRVAPAAQQAAAPAPQATAAGPDRSSSLQAASAPLPIGGAAAGRGGQGFNLPPSARSSFDSLGSDPGAVWYWGSPGSASSDALGGSRRASLDVPRGGCGSRASHDSWVDVPGPGCPAAAGSHGPSRLGADCRQAPPALPRPVLHVGSAPNPGGLAGAFGH